MIRLSGAFATTLGSQVRGAVCTGTEGSLLLKYAKELRIDILGSRVNNSDLEKHYNLYWKTISDEEAPFSNLTFCFVHDVDSEPPFEGRWIITKNGGLKLGTNISLLGSRKEVEISVLKPNDALKIRDDGLIEYVSRRKSIFNSQRVYYKGFSF